MQLIVWTYYWKIGGGKNMGEMNCEKGETYFYFIQQHHAEFTFFCHYKTNLMLQNPTKM
jgi:hypothetical protein